MNKYVQVAKEIEPKINDKNIGPHTFRHTTAMHLLQSGVDLNVIKSWLGHVDVSTTHGYAAVSMCNFSGYFSNSSCIDWV